MIKQLTNEIIISFDDTHNGTNHRFLATDEAQARVKARRLLATTPSGNVIIKRAADGAVLDYFEN